MAPIMLYECPKLPGKARLTAVQCERNQARAAKAAKMPRVCTLKVRSSGSEALIHLAPCVRCPGVEALQRIGVIDPPTAYQREAV